MCNFFQHQTKYRNKTTQIECSRLDESIAVYTWKHKSQRTVHTPTNQGSRLQTGLRSVKGPVKCVSIASAPFDVLRTTLMMTTMRTLMVSCWRSVRGGHKKRYKRLKRNTHCHVAPTHQLPEPCVCTFNRKHSDFFCESQKWKFRVKFTQFFYLSELEQKKIWNNSSQVIV